MSASAALPAPPGIIPNLQHPTDVIRTINFATQGLTIGSVTIAVALQVYSKIAVFGKSFRYEDYAIYISWVFMVGYCVCGIFLSVYGGGYNQWEVPATSMKPFAKVSYVATVFYMPMTLFVKLSLLLIIVRVFTPYKWICRAMYALTCLITAYYLAGWLVKIFACKPIAAYWQPQRGKCLDQRSIIIADAITSTASDLIILTIPIPLTWSLQMPRAKKLRVAGMLSAGGLATAFSIYRLALVILDGNSPNYTMLFVRVVLSGNAEVGIGLICACLPAISRLGVFHQLTARGTSKNRSTDLNSGSDTVTRRSKAGGFAGSRSSIKMNVLADVEEPESDQTELIRSQQIYRTVEYTVQHFASSDCSDGGDAKHGS